MRVVCRKSIRTVYYTRANSLVTVMGSGVVIIEAALDEFGGGDGGRSSDVALADIVKTHTFF